MEFLVGPTTDDQHKHNTFGLPSATWRVACRWLAPYAYSGDDAKLEVTAEPDRPDGRVVPDGEVVVEILHPSTGKAVDSVKGKMANGKLTTHWCLRAQTKDWRSDQIPFRTSVSSIGVNATSDNKIQFLQRPTTKLKTLNNLRGTCSYASKDTCRERADARLDGGRVSYRLKIGLWRASSLKFERHEAEQMIMKIWNGGFKGKTFHRKNCRRGPACNCPFDCCKVDFHIDVESSFGGADVNPGCHWYVKLSSNKDSCHSETRGGAEIDNYGIGRWAVPPLATTSYAHEVGHMLGQFDEYLIGCHDPDNIQPNIAACNNLMSTECDTTLLNRHYRWVLEFVNDHTNKDPYEIIPDDNSFPSQGTH